MTSRANASHVGSCAVRSRFARCAVRRVSLCDARRGPTGPSATASSSARATACAALYAVLAECGFFPLERLETFCAGRLTARRARHPQGHARRRGLHRLARPRPVAVGAGMALAGAARWRVAPRLLPCSATASATRARPGRRRSSPRITARQPRRRSSTTTRSRASAASRTCSTSSRSPTSGAPSAGACARSTATTSDAIEDAWARAVRAGPAELHRRPHGQGQGRELHGGPAALALPRAAGRAPRPGACGARGAADEDTRSSNTLSSWPRRTIAHLSSSPATSGFGVVEKFQERVARAVRQRRRRRAEHDRRRRRDGALRQDRLHLLDRELPDPALSRADSQRRLLPRGQRQGRLRRRRLRVRLPGLLAPRDRGSRRDAHAAGHDRRRTRRSRRGSGRDPSACRTHDGPATCGSARRASRSCTTARSISSSAGRSGFATAATRR